MNPVIAALREHIDNQNVRFVFPSQTAAGLWARKTCTLGIARSVAANRFLAWDRFKEEAVCEEGAGLEQREATPASSVIRRLFADALLRKNADAPFLKALVPVEHASGGAVFAPFIARLLPSLAYWERMMINAGVRDAEDEDYTLVKKEYAAFLERNGLFEPSWEEIKIREGSYRYVLFFPELIEDFAEYDALLTAPRFIRVGVEALNNAEGPALVFYKSARDEIRAVVMELQRLHGEEGLPYEDMALSVPDLEEMEPVLLREFYLRHVPFTRRAGKKLGETGAGRMFLLVNECAASGFSFNSLKALILNDHIPWKEKEKNSSLISFGIKYNCVSGYVQDGIAVDIWEEAFKEVYRGGGQWVLFKDLESYYRELKRRVLALAGSKNFSELRKYYFAFRNSLLDMEKISEEDNAVLSRCIEELSSLIELEGKFDDSGLVPASPLTFFISCLGEKEYVRSGQKPGVNIFRWRVAAASPFCCHFVLNASQGAAAVLYQPMKFLRQDKRKALGLEDNDASGAFFSLCDTGEDETYKCHTRISASALTFSGWAIPHSFFAQGKTMDAHALSDASKGSDALPCQEDPYREERRFWREREKSSGAALQKIFPLQKSSYGFWERALEQKGNYFSFFSSPVTTDATGKLLEKAIIGEDGYLTVSPTRDLNVFYDCPIFWLYARIFKTEKFSLEAALLDDTSLGLLYHKILELLYDRIKNEDGAFDSSRLEAYKRWALEITVTAIKEHPAFKGPLAVPLVSSQAAGMAKKISRLLEMDAKSFDGYRILELELPVSLKTEGLHVKGIIDRVSVSPDGVPVIIDYKTGDPPKQTAINDIGKVPLSEFQMPLYIKLYEEMSGVKDDKVSAQVEGAFFYSINGRKINTVMGENPGGRTKPPNREEYKPFLEAAEKQIEEFGQKVKAFDFAPWDLRIKDCFICVYKTACRSAYFEEA